jgi:hypothetical protein
VIVLALFGSVAPQVLRETRQLAESTIYASRVQNKVRLGSISRQNFSKILKARLKLVEHQCGAGTRPPSQRRSGFSDSSAARLEHKN